MRVGLCSYCWWPKKKTKYRQSKKCGPHSGSFDVIITELICNDHIWVQHFNMKCSSCETKKMKNRYLWKKKVLLNFFSFCLPMFQLLLWHKLHALRFFSNLDRGSSAIYLFQSQDRRMFRHSYINILMKLTKWSVFFHSRGVYELKIESNFFL